ncbi:MAG TPA: universal stress protein [Acidimicrobiales bacterium]
MDEKDARTWIVVGIDGSPQARNALRWSVWLAPLLDAQIAVVHGTGLLDHLDDEGGELAPAHEHLAAIRATVERDWCGVGIPGRPVHVDVRERPAVDAVLAAAEERDASLVVLGTRGAGIAPAQALGSTALQVLRRLAGRSRPALVVPDPADCPSVEVRRLVVGVDGSTASLSALAWAADLAALTGASCEVVATIEDAPWVPLGPSAAVTAEGETDAPRRLRRLARDWCQPLRAAELQHRVTIVRGAPAPTLVRVARMLAADLLVVGSSGAGASGNPLLGSVSRRVAHDAGRPVAVVPAGARLIRPARVPAGVADTARW